MAGGARAGRARRPPPPRGAGSVTAMADDGQFDDDATAEGSAGELRLYVTYAAAVLVTLTLLGAAVECAQSWRSHARRQRDRSALGSTAADRLRAVLVLKVDEGAADREETLWRRVFGAVDTIGSGLCDSEEWMLALRQLVPAEDTSTIELQKIFDTIDVDGHGLLTPQALGNFVWQTDCSGDDTRGNDSYGKDGATLVFLAAASVPLGLRATQAFSWHEIVWLCCAVFIAALTIGGLGDADNHLGASIAAWLHAGVSLRALLVGAERRNPISSAHPRRSPSATRTSQSRIIPPPRRSKVAVKFGGSSSLGRSLDRSPNATTIRDHSKRQLVSGLRDLAYSETRGVQDLDTLFYKLDRDHDGKIGREDFTWAARRLVDAELSKTALRDLFDEVARARLHAVRRKNKELEQPEEISKKALAAFVWPRRAKTPPPSTRNTSRSSRSSRQVDEFGNAAGGMLEQNKKMSPQLSQQAVLSQQAQVIEEITPNWAAAARWLAQAHTHRKAGRLGKAADSLRCGLAMAAEHRGCLEMLEEVQAEQANVESAPLYSSLSARASRADERPPHHDSRKAGREHWRRQQQQSPQLGADACRALNAVGNMARKPDATATSDDLLTTQTPSRGKRWQDQQRSWSVEKRRTWRPPVKSPPHAGWRSSSPVQQQQRQQQEQRRRRRGLDKATFESAHEASTGHRYSRRASSTSRSPPEDARAAAWAYHSSRERTSPPPNPSRRRKRVNTAERQQQENQHEDGRVGVDKQREAREKGPGTQASTNRLHATPKMKIIPALGSAQLSVSDVVAKRQMQPRMTARGQRRQRQLEEEQAATQAQTGDVNSGRARTPAQHRRTVARLHAAEVERQNVLAAERKRRARREKKVEEQLLELSDVGKVIQLTTKELDAAVQERRHAARLRQQQQAKEEAAAAKAAHELEMAAEQRWQELEKELEAAAIDPHQPAPRFTPTVAVLQSMQPANQSVDKTWLPQRNVT